MTSTWRWSALIAAALFLALFLFRLLTGPASVAIDSYGDGFMQQQSDFKLTRNNYASIKAAPSAVPAPLLGEQQKYEKIATLTQTTARFDDDKVRILSSIGAHQAIIQLERATGLAGRRALLLGVGVPPEKFDAFVDAAKAIGRSAQIDIVKNDKTNEYLKLKAQRTTLEKARTALEALTTSGGSVDERVKVQSKLTEIEEKIQALGVSLGEFDTQNELCTVKLTLLEQGVQRATSFA
ncbi:DUF4349 domain-containing protein, partial [Bradyrhizobium sp.]|uniref:DUF4349 domain-containing protein n=1 Tax=Bradyrhizobium sp. TaxID=376 RepID=UPI003C72FCD9